MRKLFFLLIIAFAIISCGKSGDIIPSVGVNFQAALSDPRLSALGAAGGSVAVSGYGVAGLLLYREADGSYAAYDRCSSYMPQNRCAIMVDISGFTATDPCSGSKFSLSDGTPVKAPATRALRAYNVQVSKFEIFVSN